MFAAAFLRRLSPLFSLMLSAWLLVGCTQMGSYQDPVAPDAAKLRFVANTDNATVNYFDAEHCDGLTTGILNNLFVKDSARRVGMSVAPPEKARGYLEFKLPTEKDVILQVNTQTGYSVCGAVFSFQPERSAEYELTFDLKGRQCSTLLQRVQRLDGKDVRTPIAIKRGGFAACEGRNPIFPKPPVLLPDTPERTALIDRIIAGSMFTLMAPEAGKETSATFSSEKLDALISERKAKLGFDMPDDYWTLYRQNLVQFDHEAHANRPELMKRTTEEYRRRLRSIDDKRLKEWAGTPDKRANAAPFEEEKSMIEFYGQTSRELLAETVRNHLDRMAKMDEQYNVCSRYAECWKRG